MSFDAVTATVDDPNASVRSGLLFLPYLEVRQGADLGRDMALCETEPGAVATRVPRHYRSRFYYGTNRVTKASRPPLKPGSKEAAVTGNPPAVYPTVNIVPAKRATP